MTPYPPSGSYTTESREVAVSETWDTWANAQAMDNVEVVDGSLQLVDEPAIPDSVVAQYDATQDGKSTGSVTSIPDQVSTFSLSGTATLISDGINGNQTYRFDGVDDDAGNTTISVQEPFAVLLVVELKEQPDSGNFYFDTSNTQGGFSLRDFNDGYQLYRGDQPLGTGGNPTQDGFPDLVICEGFSTDSGSVEVNGMEVVSGSSASGFIDGFLLASLQGSNNLEVDIGEAAIMGGYTTSELDAMRQQMHDKWGFNFL